MTYDHLSDEEMFRLAKDTLALDFPDGVPEVTDEDRARLRQVYEARLRGLGDVIGSRP